MFTEQDIKTLSEVFAATRAYLVTTQPDNRDGLAGILQFESSLIEKMKSSLPEPEEVKEEEA